MPLLKLCPRCQAVISANEKKCKNCAARYNKQYDKHRRDQKAERFYNSREWSSIRQYVLAKHKGLDLYQLHVNGKIVPANTVHHIEEFRENPSRALDVNNLIPLDAGTHAHIHKLYEKEKKKTQELLFSLVSKEI